MPEYLQNNLFHAKDKAGILHIFEGKKMCAFPTLRVSLECWKGWHLYLCLIK